MKRIFVIIFMLLSICGYSQIDTLNCDTDTIWENITLKINSNNNFLDAKIDNVPTIDSLTVYAEIDTAQSTADSAQTTINSAVVFTTYLYSKVQVDSLDSINALGHNNYDSVYVYNYFNARIDSLRNRVEVLEDSIVTYNNHFTWIYGQLNALWDSIGSTAPDLTAAICDSAYTINDTMIYLFFSENLDPDSVPNVDSFYVTENGTRFGVQTVTITNDTVRMEMDSTILAGSTLLVDYLGNKLSDLSGNKTANWTDTTITNNVSDPLADGDTIHCTSVGIAYASSTAHQGYWEFSIYKAASTVPQIAFISASNSSTTATGGYSMRSGNTEFLYLYANAVGQLNGTADAYYNAGTWYRLRYERNSVENEFFTGAVNDFRVLIKGGSFGETFVPLTVTIGTNPVSSTNWTSSTYFTISLGTDDYLADININGTYLMYDDFTTSTGTFVKN